LAGLILPLILIYFKKTIVILIARLAVYTDTSRTDG